MISNTSFKLKASKSSRDLHEYQNSHEDDYEDESIDGDLNESQHGRYHGYRDGKYRGVSKPRQTTEFRSSRGSERRGNSYRGRGGAIRKGDREYIDSGGGYGLNNKYYDSLTRNCDSSGVYHHSKCYDEKKTEIKLNLPEDTRISKLLRRLSMEKNQENSLLISKKLLEVLLIPDNASYIRKSFHILGDSMLQILSVAPGPLAKQQAARALGRMGYIMAQENDFERYESWLISKVQVSNEEMKYLCMKSLKETLAFEKKRPQLQNHSAELLQNIILILESTENIELFQVVLDNLLSLVDIYPEDFYPQFSNMMDVVFGWHVDPSQPLCNIEYISKSVQRISKYFKLNLACSLNWIFQFKEDIETYTKHLCKKNSTEIDDSAQSNSIEVVTVSILALNTVLKCLGENFHPVNNNNQVTIKFVTDCLNQIIKTSLIALEMFVPDSLIIASNDSISIFLGILGTQSGCVSKQLYTLMDLELSLISEFSDATIISLLLMLSKVIKELSANLPIELIEKLVGPDSEIIKLRHSPFVDVQEATICVYQALLNLKNIPLLHEAYRYLLSDLEVIYKKIVPGVSLNIPNNPFKDVDADPQEAELSIIFLLRCLSQLANASGSIIGMWALKPSILELLGVLLEPHSVLLTQNAPSLQYSLLHLLYSHCRCYNHFITRSSLVIKKQDMLNVIAMGLPESLNMEEVASKSPNSENFAIILGVICKALDTETTSETKLLLLNWISDILVNCEIYLEVLYNNEKFKPVIEVLVKTGYNFNERIILSVCDNLEKLLCNKQLSWNNNFLVAICDLCKLHMNSNNVHIRKKYTNLSANIPWDVTIVEFNKMHTIENVQRCTSLNDYNNCSVTLGQHLHLNGTIFGEITTFQFKIFMQYLLQNEVAEGNWLEDLFFCCWPLESDGQTNVDQFRDLALNSQIVLNNWCTWEAAQFCVNSKLRTPLGKPNETFTKIENTLKKLARIVMQMKDKDTQENNDVQIAVDQKHVRLLLQFVENLEKSMCNASDGSAVALPQQPKPVRTFFQANASTCHEWLTRIRVIVICVSLHAGESCIALRHGHLLLKELIANKKQNTSEFERAVMYVTLSLLKLHEPEALQGLYVWCKNISNRIFVWIKYASEQAAKNYENALKGYKSILDDVLYMNFEDKKDSEDKPEKKLMDEHVQNFICDQIINCHKELNNWSSLVELKNDHLLSDRLMECGKGFIFNKIDWNCIENLFNFEIGKHALEKLNDWGDNEKEMKHSWGIYNVLCSTESNLYKIAFNVACPENINLLNELDSNISIIQNTLEDNINSLPSDFLRSFSLLHYIGNGLKNVLNNMPAFSVLLVSEDFESEIHKVDSSVLAKILWWTEYFSKIQNQGSSTFCSNLRFNIIKKARKEKNFDLACKEIYKFLKEKDLWCENGQPVFILNIANMFMQKLPELNMWSLDIAKVVMEVIKLSYNNEDNRQMTFNLCAMSSTAISKHAEMYGGKEFRQISSKILLKLATWLPNNEHISITEINSQLGKLIMVLPEISMIDSNTSGIIPMMEMAVGKLLYFSVNQCPSLAKNWNTFGSWCYRWGRKIVDRSSDLESGLTEDDIIAIRKLLPFETNQDDLAQILSILSQKRAVADEEDIDSNEINTSEMILSQLQSVPVLHYAYDNQLEELVKIWRNVQKRIYAYYELSADAYFKYLHLASNADNFSKKTECATIIVTLRLLRLIVKHALELQTVLEVGLETTPTHPWKVIIPQLFSRLNHPESYVRHRVSDLLRRVAEDAPHLITFPAVVGALEGGLKFDFSEISLPKDCLSQNHELNEDTDLNEIEDNYDSDKEECKNVLQACFKTMVDTLSKQAPETIAQVQMLVKELRRITLLWDELWLGTLAQHHNEISRRQHQLELEIEKVNENTNLTKEEKVSLIAEKHRIIMKPIIFVLEQLHEITSAEPETPHEKQFQEKYSCIIGEVLEKLKNPEKPDKPQESWQPIKELQKRFQQKFHKRTSYTLKMQDISPILASIKNTLIAMPGLSTSTKTPVTISSVSNHVSILPTKTKPKKLIFYGSDGQKYTYLFKGLEDLHLDERIMQFLSIVNTMMAHSSIHNENNLYRARHYSVIPLGPRSGLINWVDGTTPLFTLYKRWQQREVSKINAKFITNPNATVLRPSELFYNKLNPLLKEHGVKNIENRKEWPLAILKRVLTELMEETPSDLLSKEFWFHSINACTWWQVTKKYSYSLAVMSIIGYIIGLGDRHLDNVLVDLTSGEVVHIDYNVCFEKGKTLRVPEKVPFRLTPNIRDALGVTGVEGIFRLACENVLKTMKKGRETLLTLLEAFVYDPLVDWTISGEVLAGTSFGGLAGNLLAKHSKKDLEKEITLSMYNVRCTEIKAEWSANKSDVLECMLQLKEKLKMWLELNQKIAETEDLLQDLHQQMALVKEAEAHGANKHSLYTLPSRYELYKKTQDAVNNAKNDLDRLIVECEVHLDRYTEALNNINGPQLSQWFTTLSINVDDNGIRVFDLVKEFLQNAGQTSMITQCEQSENDVAQLVQQHTIVAKKCIQMLQEYNSVLAQCPVSFYEKHRTYLCLKWCKYLEESCNIIACDTVYQQFCTFIKPSKFLNTVFDFSYHLTIVHNEVTAQAKRVYEEYTKLLTQNSISSLESAYENARLGVVNFLQREKGATGAFEFAIAGELLSLNKNLLNLETTAHRSGEYLRQLMLRDGEWFLEDLVQNSNRAVEFLNSLPLQQTDVDDNKLVQIRNNILITNNLYKGLHDLIFNFHTIILPETMKKIQNEEVSVIHMIGELNNLILSIGTSIPDLIVQLEKIVRCVLMQMDVNASCEFVLEKVNDIKIKYFTMVNSQLDVLNQGHMLLMGFNGLFDKLDQELNNLVNGVTALEIPTSWRKLDYVKEAKSIAANIFNPRVKSLLEDIFLLKRLQTISEFFTLCVEMTQSFKAVVASTDVFTDEQLIKPVKKFVADFIWYQFLGVSTELISYSICFLLQHLGMDVSNEIEQKDIGAESKVPLDELVQKGWALFTKNGTFTANVFAQANSLETNLKVAWEKLQEPKKLEQNCAVLQSSMVRIQNQLTAHYFMFEDLLKQQHFSHSLFLFVRSKFILELRKEVTALGVINLKLTEAREQQKNLIASAEQRLKWAAGANPDVNEVLMAFESAVSKHENQLEIEQNIVNVILSTCNTILQHELLRMQSPEAAAFDKIFLNSCEKWRAVCQCSDSKMLNLSPTEENIMKLFTPNLIEDTKWLNVISEKITDIISKVRKELCDHKTKMLLTIEDVTSLIHIFANHYSQHNKIISDVKVLIRSMTKIDECSYQAQAFLSDYRKYVEHFMPFSKYASGTKKENIFVVNEINGLLENLVYLEQNSERVYEGIFNIEGKDHVAKDFIRPQLVRQEGISLSPLKTLPVKQESTTKGQQRNAYAVGVWRRVRMKLEGRDPNPGRKYTTHEQVDYVIREATNLDNLALLYEGWTPWV